MSEEKPTGLALLRVPFEPHQISKLPKPTKKQTEIVRQDYTKGIRCQVCGGWHHPDVIHLDYVGHAALTDRLLDCDPEWGWEPIAFQENGLPLLDNFGGMWIRLTVCGHTRLGYGSADGKTGGDAIKELIGDALRNAAMRFGAALDLWHKGDLHISDEEPPEKPEPANIAQQKASKPHWQVVGELTCKTKCKDAMHKLNAFLEEADTPEAVEALVGDDFKECVAASEMNNYFWNTQGDVVGLKDRIDNARIRVSERAA